MTVIGSFNFEIICKNILSKLFSQPLPEINLCIASSNLKDDCDGVHEKGKKIFSAILMAAETLKCLILKDVTTGNWDSLPFWSYPSNGTCFINTLIYEQLFTRLNGKRFLPNIRVLRLSF